MIATITTMLDAVETTVPPRLGAALRRLVAAANMRGSPGGFTGNGLSLSLYEAQGLERLKLAIINRPDRAPWSEALIRPSLGGIAWVRARDGVTAALPRSEPKAETPPETLQ
jgi:hypothetical protein